MEGSAGMKATAGDANDDEDSEVRPLRCDEEEGQGTVMT